MDIHHLSPTLSPAMQHDLFIKAPPNTVLPMLIFLVATHGFLYDRSFLSQDLEGTLEYGKVLSCTDGFDDLTFVCGVLRASKGAGEVCRECMEWPGGRDDGEYLREYVSRPIRRRAI